MGNIRRIIGLILCSLILSVAGIMGPVLAADGEEGVNLLQNPSFEMTDEGIPSSWAAKDNWSSGSVTASPEGARTGDTGIKLQTEVTTDYWIRQTVEVEEGGLYELSVWLKSEVPASMYHGRAVLKAEFYRDTADGNGWRGQQTGAGIYESVADWEKMNMYVDVPEDANLVQVYLRLYGPGLAYFDDASLHQIDQIPGLHIETDRIFYYEDMEEGLITGTIGLEHGDLDNKTFEVTIYSEESGLPIVQETGMPATEWIDFSFDPRLMTLQEPYTIEATLHAADGEVLLADTTTIYRWERPSAFREDGALIVDGEPFFPMIGYHVVGYDVAIEDYPKVSKIVNTLQGDNSHPDRETARYHLDLAHEHGLKVFFPLYPNVWEVEGPRGYSYVTEMVTEFKDHPAVIGWMIQDEPNKFEIQGHPNIQEVIAETYRIIRSLDPVNPTYMVINDPDGFDTFGRLTDIVVTDPYPLLRDPITMVRDHVREAKALNPEKPVWNVLQAFHLPGNSRYPYLPNITELRNMIYQSVIEGAQGLGYYSFVDPGWNLLESELYTGIVAFTEKELPHFEKLVLHGEQREAWQNEAVQWNMWELEGELYAAVVNVSDGPQSIDISLPESGYHIETIAPEYHQSSIRGNQLSVELAALESKLIKLTPFTTISDFFERVEHHDNEGQFANQGIARALNMHLRALEQFEQQGDMGKVLKHMEGFQALLRQHHGNGFILEDAYYDLMEASEAMVQQIGAVLLPMNIHLENAIRVHGEWLRLHIQLDNESNEDVHAPVLTVQWPEEFGLDLIEMPLSDINAGQSEQIVIDIVVPENVPVGNHSLITELAFDYAGDQVSYARESRVTILPILEAAIDTKQLQLSMPGEYPVSFLLKNNAFQPIDLAFQEDAANLVTVEMNSVQIGAGQTMEVEGLLHIPASLVEGTYEAAVAALVNGIHVLDLSLHIHLDYNFLQNPGFEQLIGGNPVGWDPSVSWANGFVTATAEAARTGEVGIQINSDTTSEYRVRQRVYIDELDENRMFELSAWLKNEIRSSRGKAQMKVEFYQDAPNASGFVGDAWSEEFGTSPEWENVSMIFELPEEANIISVLLRLYGPGTAYYDDVSLKLMENGIE